MTKMNSSGDEIRDRMFLSARKRFLLVNKFTGKLCLRPRALSYPWKFDEKEEGGLSAQRVNDGKSSLLVTFADLELFDCPVCIEVLSSPVFQCQNGHIACSKCCKKIGYKCPSCKLYIGGIRCLVLQKILECMKVYCDYRQYGCMATFNCSEKPEHKETCAFVPFTCPISDCKLNFNSSNLKLHVSKDHSLLHVKYFDYNKHFMVTVGKSEEYKIFQGGENGNVFILRHQIRAQESTISISLACLGSKSDQNGGFKYELEAKKYQRSYKLKSLAEFVREQTKASTVVDVLKVPEDFYTSDGNVKLGIVIRD